MRGDHPVPIETAETYRMIIARIETELKAGKERVVFEKETRVSPQIAVYLRSRGFDVTLYPHLDIVSWKGSCD